MVEINLLFLIFNSFCKKIKGCELKINKLTQFYAFIISVLLFFPSCSSVPVNLGIAKEEVIKYHASGEYDKDVNNAADNAVNELSKISPAKRDIVVFDIDETSLSNYEYSKKYDFGYVPSLWTEWIKSAKAPAIAGVKKLYDYLISRGFGIVFLTGRKDYEYKATYRNLMNAGYTKFDTLIVRTPNEYKLDALKYKSNVRTALTEHGYKIVGDVGDQYSDLDGPYHGIQVKIPNYQYIIR